MISPRINAASRLEKAQTAARLLTTKDAAEASALAAALNRINDERKGLVAATLKEARRRLMGRSPEQKEKIIVVGSPEWRPGILGLVAQKLAEESGKPAFVWGRGGSHIKGSCRSDGVINIVELMSHAKGVLEEYGGHEFSGGFSLREEDVHRLAEALSNAFVKLKKGQMLQKEIMLDRELAVEEVQGALGDIQKLSPYGEGNRKPLFLFPNVSITNVRQFGKAQDHLELSLRENASDIAGIAFFSTPESFQKKAIDGISSDIIAHVETDWRGRPRLRVVDVL